MQKYNVNQQLVETVLAWVTSGEIAIPEIQRPFVWDASKVRDLMDSLYQGYPVGYIIAWRNPNVKLKDGSTSEGKKILIDGQQRITALTAAILGQNVVNKHYKRVRIKIAFDPLNEKFEVQNPAILKNKAWLPDISEVLSGKIGIIRLVRNYLELNPDTDESQVEKAFTNLINITKKPIGIIELGHELDIDTVTEIFIRINSKGVVLSQADFAMSKIATNIEYGGNDLRKAIDYFCHLAVAPEYYRHINENDVEFCKTDYFKQMAWLKDETDELYDPDYNDLLRVAFTSQFNRGRLADLVSLLSGRNFEARTFEDEIAEDSFSKLKAGVANFMNETNYKRFLMILKSAGFVSPDLVRSQNVINFGYILFLKLRERKENPVLIEKYVRKWIVFSILTGRYSGSPESVFDYDIKQIASRPFDEYLTEREAAELPDAFWEASLPVSLITPVFSSPFFHVFLASQVWSNDNGFLSKEIKVRDMLTHRGDIHHLFPKDYLKKNGLERNDYNQIANYAMTQSEINIKVGNKSPREYFDLVCEQIEKGDLKLSGLTSVEALRKNLLDNAVPSELMKMEIKDYAEFLTMRRKLMADKMKRYYLAL